jgi:hypothetical protein
VGCRGDLISVNILKCTLGGGGRMRAGYLSKDVWLLSRCKDIPMRCSVSRADVS